MIKERNYGIDLLRLVLMFMVCILHTLGQGGILNSSPAGTLGYKTFWLMEIMAYCAVDGFAMISGYMASNKPRRFEKLIEMWFQAFFYSFILTLIFTIVGINAAWERADMIRCATPVTSEMFWYFTAFFVLFLVMPVLDRFIFSIDEKTAKKALIVIVIVFSCMEKFGDPFKFNAGYSAAWLIVLYCFGALAKRIRLFEEKKNITLIIFWAICILGTWAVLVYFNSWNLLNYVSPTILMSGFIMIVLFSRLRLDGKIISILAPLAFGIYLFQLNPVIWNNVLADAFVWITDLPLFVGVILVFLFAAAIFISGLLVEFLRKTLARALRIPKLSRKIAFVLNALIEKLFVFLK